LHCGHTARLTFGILMFIARREFLRDLYVLFLGTATINPFLKRMLGYYKKANIVNELLAQS